MKSWPSRLDDGVGIPKTTNIKWNAPKLISWLWGDQEEAQEGRSWGRKADPQSWIKCCSIDWVVFCSIALCMFNSEITESFTFILLFTEFVCTWMTFTLNIAVKDSWNNNYGTLQCDNTFRCTIHRQSLCKRWIYFVSITTSIV